MIDPEKTFITVNGEEYIPPSPPKYGCVKIYRGNRIFTFIGEVHTLEDGKVWAGQRLEFKLGEPQPPVTLEWSET